MPPPMSMGKIGLGEFSAPMKEEQKQLRMAALEMAKVLYYGRWGCSRRKANHKANDGIL
jgi:hypothetical protein